jgi:hypothetical protein
MKILDVGHLLPARGTRGSRQGGAGLYSQSLRALRAKWFKRSVGDEAMSNDYKQKAVDLLKALETRDPKPFSYINPQKYIQHNLDVGDGPAGVAALAKILPSETKGKHRPCLSRR